MSMFLTREEVAELTGYQKPGYQQRWLDAEKFGYLVDSDGHPKVLREIVLQRLGGHHKKKAGPELRLTG